jgi:hypothetical protein
VTIFGFTQNVLLAASVAGAVALLFAIWQLFRKRALTQVFAGLVGLGISVYLPLRDGLNDTHAADYFVPGLITNIGYFAAFAISLLVRYPVMGLAIGLLTGKNLEWRKDKALYRRYYWVTVMWLAMFAVRLLVQLPLYLAGQVAALGIAKLALGTPLYALVIWFTWLVVRGSLSSSKK